MNKTNFKTLNLANSLNNVGITSISDVEQGFLTLAGSSFPEELIELNKKNFINGVPFIIKKNSKGFDNIELEGQTITFEDTRVSKLHFLSLSCYGSYFQDIQLLKDSDKICSVDFHTADLLLEYPEFSGVTEGVFFKYVHNRKGKNPHTSARLWHTTVNLDLKANINKLRFEDNPAVHVFSITLEV